MMIYHLTPRALQVLRHLQVYARRRAAGQGDGYVSTRNLEDDLGIPQTSLTRRITDLQLAGYLIDRRKVRNPATRLLYTEYRLAQEEPAHVTAKAAA